MQQVVCKNIDKDNEINKNYDHNSTNIHYSRHRSYSYSN